MLMSFKIYIFIRFFCVLHFQIVKEHIDETTTRSTHTALVEVNGIEPMASCVQGRRSPS